MRLLLACIAALVFLVMALGALGVIEASAHQNYIGKRDPVFLNSCCGGYDCAVAPENTVFQSSGGFKVIMTLEQAQTVHHSARAPIAAVVPYARVQPSWDANIHVCIAPTDRTLPRGGVLCLFIPFVG